MGLRLEGCRALVTGASSGIGAATASALAREGCRLVLAGRDESRLNEVAARTGASPVVADLVCPEGIELVAEAAGAPDLLVNNAGAGWAGELARMPAETVLDLVAVNLSAPLLLTQSVLPAMARRGRGHVVFVSSIATVGVREEAVYSATKAALRAFAASVRYEAAADRVGVTTVLPGAVRTPFFSRRGQRYERGFPRPVAPEAVASALVRGVRRGRAEVFVPRWLTAAARVQGAVPGVFHELARRFG